jgi:hypothetical protein
VTRKGIAILALAVGVAIVISGLTMLGIRNTESPAATVPFTISIAVEGAPIVGGNFTILTTVTAKPWVNGSEVTRGLTFLSLGVTHGVHVNTPDPGDDPWGLPSVWNLTGRNASLGITFALNVSGVYAGEFTLNAHAWWPPSSMHNWSDVQINSDGGLFNPMSVSSLGFAQYKLIVQEMSSRVRSEGSLGMNARKEGS